MAERPGRQTAINVISFSDRTCDRFRRYFDGFVDNELLVETNHEILRHIETCAECRTLLEQRREIKTRLRRAVSAESTPEDLARVVRAAVRSNAELVEMPPVFIDQRRLLQRALANEGVPEGLRRSIVTALRHEANPWTLHAGWQRRALVAAATIVVAVAATFVSLRPAPGSAEPGASLVALQGVAPAVHRLFHVAEMDHLHCNMEYPPMWKRKLADEEMQEGRYPKDWGPRGLPPSLTGLVPLIRARLGTRFELIQAHLCHAGLGRWFIHVVLRGRDQEVISIVMTERRTGESISETDARSVIEAVEPSFGRVTDRGLEIVAFDTAKYLGFVISNLDRDSSIAFSRSVVPPVQNFISKL